MKVIFLVFSFFSCSLMATELVPLFADPDGINIDRDKKIRFYVPLDSIPVKIAPTSFYKGGGKVFLINKNGKTIFVTRLIKKMNMKDMYGKIKVGLEGEIDIKKYVKNDHLEFFAEVWNDKGWKSKTRSVKVNFFNNQKIQSMINKQINSYGNLPSSKIKIKRNECIKLSGKISCYRCKNKDVALGWIIDPKLKCHEICCK